MRRPLYHMSESIARDDQARSAHGSPGFGRRADRITAERFRNAPVASLEPGGARCRRSSW